MPTGRCLAVILAAGEGTRMRSSLPKVLHEIGHRPMVGHVVATAQAAGADALAVVIGPGMDAVGALVARQAPHAETFVQTERLGTAHATLAARAAIARGYDQVLVQFGDSPLVTAATLNSVRDRLSAGADVVVAGFTAADPTGYGRLITEGDRLIAIIEEKDANPAERAVTLCNSGVMGLNGARALELLDAIDNANAKGEYYLTSAVAVAVARGLATAYVVGAEAEFLGVNTRAQLAACEAEFQARRRDAAMADGVTLIAPETVFFAHDTAIEPDVIVEPNVVFLPGVTVARGARIKAFSHLEGAHVGPEALVGPYARLRPGADLGAKVHIGNFVEIKNGRIEEGAKVNHLTYIGDARIGPRSNIGAGTITCNYDGFGKYFTDIGADAFVGSDTKLVAPVKIGDGAYVGSGSVVTQDVPPDALVVARAREVVKEGWAKTFRERMKAKFKR